MGDTRACVAGQNIRVRGGREKGGFGGESPLGDFGVEVYVEPFVVLFVPLGFPAFGDVRGWGAGGRGVGVHVLKKERLMGWFGKGIKKAWRG